MCPNIFELIDYYASQGLGTEKNIREKIQSMNQIDVFDSEESDFNGLIKFSKALISILNL